MAASDKSEDFVRLLTENQTRLYGYVYSLLSDHSRTADVVQETNVALWRKLADFDTNRPFLPWAYTVARFQVLAQLRDHRRDRLLLDEELAASIGDEIQNGGSDVDELRESLRPCLQALNPEKRQLVEHRYFQSMTIADLAESSGRSVTSIKVTLMRIRRQLAECIERRKRVEAEA